MRKFIISYYCPIQDEHKTRLVWAEDAMEAGKAFKKVFPLARVTAIFEA